jgi:hypothetical protein
MIFESPYLIWPRKRDAAEIKPEARRLSHQNFIPTVGKEKAISRRMLVYLKGKRKAEHKRWLYGGRIDWTFPSWSERPVMTRQTNIDDDQLSLWWIASKPSGENLHQISLHFEYRFENREFRLSLETKWKDGRDPAKGTPHSTTLSAQRRWICRHQNMRDFSRDG